MPLSTTSRPASPAPPRAAHPPSGERDENALTVERLDGERVAAHRDAWDDLLGRCLEANVFLDPGFALAAVAHFEPAQRPDFILVWSRARSGARRLIAICPLAPATNPFRRLAASWSHELTALGLPLLDRDEGDLGLDAALAFIARSLPRCRGVTFDAVPADGPTAALLRRSAEHSGCEVAVMDRWYRAVLWHDEGESRSGLGALSPKGAKEAQRQRRRLAERGRLHYADVNRDGEVAAAMERFLQLEARGWKGKAGTALSMRPAQAAFARSMASELGRRGRCRIGGLMLDGVPIAMAVVLSCGRTDYLWKVAYDEDFARYSPGVQLVIEFTEQQKRDEQAVLTDSCAVADHPMIDRLWRDRLAMEDLIVAVTSGRSPVFRAAVARERLRRRLRAAVKRAVRRYRRFRA